MIDKKLRILALVTASSLALNFTAIADWITQWQAGTIGGGQVVDQVGGGPDVDFVRENGQIDAAPGNPNSPGGNNNGDDHYYFAGTYPAPIGTVAQDEISFERAFTAGDPFMHVHFNLPIDPLVNDSTPVRFTFEPWTLQAASATVTNRRYGVEVYFNGTRIMDEVTITGSDIQAPRTLFTSTPVTLGDVGAIYGPGGDNVVELRGINYSSTGGANWAGIDYHALELNVIPEPSSFGLVICGSIIAALTFRRRKV